MTLSGQIYICSRGETFDIIADNIYGDEKYACELLSANPSLCHIPVFMGGETLEIPVVEVVSIDSDTDNGAVDYMPANAPWKE